MCVEEHRGSAGVSEEVSGKFYGPDAGVLEAGRLSGPIVISFIGRPLGN